MSNYVQSVRIDQEVYVGGGFAGFKSPNNSLVMVYNTHSHQWHLLPPYKTTSFAMVIVNNQLVLVGGMDHKYASTSLLGAWEADSRQWTYPYPRMPTARQSSSAIGKGRWLIVAGGMLCGNRLSTVEVLDVDCKQWCTVPSSPRLKSWSSMKSVVHGDVWYLMGGYINYGSETDTVYSAYLPAVISQANSSSKKSSAGIWMEISGLGHYGSAPFCIDGSLYAFGGTRVTDKSTISTIHRYLPETKKWVRVGDLPTSRYSCTCTVTSDGEVFVAGGIRAKGSPLLKDIIIGCLDT